MSWQPWRVRLWSGAAGMSDRVGLRGLVAGDREAVETILRASGAFRPEEVNVGLELVEESLEPSPGTDYQWQVAELDGRVVGFACFGAVPMTEGTFDLYWLAVDPALRGRGFAAILDDAVSEAVKRQGGRWLLAETSSTPPYAAARRFYEKQGYRLQERIADFYREGDDRLTFGKRVDRATEAG